MMLELQFYPRTSSHIENALLSFTFLFLTLPVIWSFISNMKSSFFLFLPELLVTLLWHFYFHFQSLLLQLLYLQAVLWISEFSETVHQYDWISSMVKIPFYYYNSVEWFPSVAICMGIPFYNHIWTTADDGRFVRKILVRVQIYGTFSWQKL